MKKILSLILFASVLSACGGPSMEEDLARCLTNSGAELYTTSTCGHCKNQKEMFGEAVEFLPIIVCDESAEMQQKCVNENIAGVPTWKFADGTRVSGVQGFDQLAAKGKCEIIVD